jgi:hypothetical protein
LVAIETELNHLADGIAVSLVIELKWPRMSAAGEAIPEGLMEFGCSDKAGRPAGPTRAAAVDFASLARVVLQSHGCIGRKEAMRR